MLSQSPIEAHYQTLFDEFNRRYFNSKLPAYRIKFTDRIAAHPYCRGKIYRRQKLIKLRASSDDSLTVSILLHEMAHAATNDKHARKFQEEMERLRQAGAPIVESSPLGPDRLTRGFVRGVAQDWLLDHPRMTLQQFVREFVFDYGYAPSATALLRKYPWVRGVFSKQKRTTRQLLNELEASELE